jgi:orotate phosphoribosyltransferase
MGAGVLRENVEHDVSCPGHTEEVFDYATFPDVVKFVMKIVKQHRYDALAACGFSGLLAMAAVCHKLGLPMIAVRKEGEYAKGDSLRTVNGVLPHKPLRYAIVDDLIASGGTVGRIISETTRRFPFATCVAIILYRHHHSDEYDATADLRDRMTRFGSGGGVGEEQARNITFHLRERSQ